MSHDYEIEQKESDRIGGIYSIITNTVIFSILFFVKAWDLQTVKPPLDGGIELNFGTDAKGFGNNQTRNKASDLKNAFDAKPNLENKNNEEKKTKPALIKAKPIVKVNSESKKKPNLIDVPLKTQTKTSPYQIEDKKSVTKPQITKPQISEPSRSKPTPVNKVEPVVSQPVQEQKPNPSGLFSKSDKKSAGSNGANEGKDVRAGGNNNGDKPGTVGDQGDPKGSIDAKGLYGKGGKGGGNGASINISGWTWKSKPNVIDDSEETGRIVFQVKVDSEGNVLSVRTVESGVSPSVLEKYKRAVQSLDLKPSSEGDTPPVSTGTITFILKSK